MHREEPVGDGRSCRNRRNLQPLAYTHANTRRRGGEEEIKKKKKEGKKERVKNKR